MDPRHDSHLPDLPFTESTRWNYAESPEPSRIRPSSHIEAPREPYRAATSTHHLTYSEDAPALPTRRRPGTTRPRPERSQQDRRTSRDDVVMSIAPAVVAPTPSRRAKTSTRFVLPPLRSLLDQALPSLVMVATAFGIAMLGPLSVFGIPLWAIAAAVPAIAFFALANEVAHPVWSHASMANVAILLAVFPVLVVRQSVSRVPYIDWSSGTLAAPMMMTLVLIGALTGVGLLAAYLCREDPEYAGVVFLPAAMLVPFFAGSTEITNLRTAMLMVAGIYLVTALLTVVVFMAPAGISRLIGPAAIMIQFLVLTAIRGADIFPVGSGVSSRLLFFLAVAATAALTIVVPMASYWMRQVMLIVRSSSRAAA